MGRILAGLATALALVGPAMAAPDVAQMSGGELATFTRAMPKGGELHNHIAGAMFGETLLAWAVEDGLCVDVKVLAIVAPCQPSGDLQPAVAVAADAELRGALVDSLSIRHPGFRGRSDHDQFFGVFARNGPPSDRVADALASVMEGLWRDPGTYRQPTPACAGQIGDAIPRPGPCAVLVAGSDKAREQWRHEHLLRVFETAHPAPQVMTAN